MTEQQPKPLGYLARCMDRRFHEITRQTFERETGLARDQYWDEGWAGGAPVAHDMTGEDYAYAHGARIFGWQGHGDKCGGQPGVSNEEIETRLDKMIAEKIQKFPDATHYRIFVTEDHITIAIAK